MVHQSINTANSSAATADSSLGTLKQSFEGEDQFMNTKESINKADKIPPFMAEERPSLLRGTRKDMT